MIMHYSDPTMPHTVEVQVQYFESKFRTFVDKAYQEMNSKMDPSVFLSRITCLPVSARTRLGMSIAIAHSTT